MINIYHGSLIAVIFLDVYVGFVDKFFEWLEDCPGIDVIFN